MGIFKKKKDGMYFDSILSALSQDTHCLDDKFNVVWVGDEPGFKHHTFTDFVFATTGDNSIPYPETVTYDDVVSVNFVKTFDDDHLTPDFIEFGSTVHVRTYHSLRNIRFYYGKDKQEEVHKTVGVYMMKMDDPYGKYKYKKPDFSFDCRLLISEPKQAIDFFCCLISATEFDEDNEMTVLDIQTDFYTFN